MVLPARIDFIPRLTVLQTLVEYKVLHGSRLDGSTPHGTQAPHPPVPSARAVPPTLGDEAAAGKSVAVAPVEASAAAAPAVPNGAASASAAVVTASPP